MAVDREIGEGSAVGIVKQRRDLTGKGKEKDHCYGRIVARMSGGDMRV
jgi:hypothetical protein